MPGLLSKLALVGSLAASLAHAYTVPLSSVDVSEQACSGMWGPKKGGNKPGIELSFTQGQGQVALVVYEWSDVGYLGVENPSLVTGDPQDYYYIPKTYICTTDALRQSLCTPTELGEFIIRFPNAMEDGLPAPNRTVADTSIFTQGLRFVESTRSLERVAARQAKGDEAETTKTGSSPAAPAATSAVALPPAEQTAAQDKENEVATYAPDQSAPIRYEVERTGYYCVGVIPVTLLPSSSAVVPAEHASFAGEARFINVFDGELAAGEHPKILWYLFLTAVYVAATAAWAALCFRYRSELLPTQWYIGYVIAYLAVEMFVTFVYYRYFNAHGASTGSTAFIVVVSILNAGRNSSSFFLLLVVAMGLSVVTPTLGPVMRRVQLLTAAHFTFGVIYSLGTVSVELETASLIGLLAIVMGLSVTLTTFLMWTAVSLNGTILHLEKRKQHSKLKMFKNLHRILMGAVFAVGGFFILSGITLSDRGSDDFAPRNWQYRWFLLDGSLSSIYACVFFSIAWLWRPTGRNVRFAMSEELAQDEEEADAEDYELAQAHAGRDSEDDLEAARPGLSQPDLSAAGPPGYDVPSSRDAGLARRQEPRDEVVFAIDDGDSDDDDDNDDDKADKKRRFRDRQAADEEEEGDMGRRDSDEGEALVGGGRSSRRG